VPSRDDGGALAAFVLLLLVAFVALLGLVVDGGTALTAHQSAEVEAEQAARSGAGALNVDALREGTVEIDPTAAVAAAEQFAAADGHPATASVAGGVVTVRVQYAVPTVVLGIVGVGSLRVSAVASAADLDGVTSGAP
jgi:Flp pilus assembly protein TadG